MMAQKWWALIAYLCDEDAAPDWDVMWLCEGYDPDQPGRVSYVD